MARCIELTPEQSRLWQTGEPQETIRIEDDIIEYAERHRLYEPIIVVTQDKKIAFALTYKGQRA